jgi:uncharacterized zinc-type alcohol dehydrogenase-like protein
MYSPLKHWGYTTGEKKTVGIVGVGGLGTMGIKIANAKRALIYLLFQLMLNHSN